MKVRLLKDHLLNGNRHGRGTLLDLPAASAQFLISRKAAELFPAPVPQPKVTNTKPAKKD